MAGWTVEPIGGTLGARVGDIDLRGPLSDEDRDALYGLLLEHLVLVFPEQAIHDDHQMDLLSSWGRPYIHPIGRTAGMVEAKVERIVDDGERPPYQDKWHTDVTWDPDAPIVGSLRAVEMPARGGDTIFASMYAAHDGLSETLRERLEGLTAWHDMGPGQAFISKAGGELVERTREQFPGTERPVIAVHPDTGRRHLNVNKNFTSHLVGFDRAESDAVLNLLYEHATQPNYTIRHEWTEGDVIVWDERCTQHFAVADHFPQRREMARLTVAAPA
ncbi:TauD/TfdA dioxygenase family protein [Candidatus Poriferisocius sp.]|uniref:TauD/TfdA dioxygenase family protein n=1 Tax=Candidatus Poriferisocius sp. TaxID=3101276 RepID=UPI003B01749F